MAIHDWRGADFHPARVNFTRIGEQFQQPPPDYFIRTLPRQLNFLTTFVEVWQRGNSHAWAKTEILVNSDDFYYLQIAPRMLAVIEISCLRSYRVIFHRHVRIEFEKPREEKSRCTLISQRTRDRDETRRIRSELHIFFFSTFLR